MSKQGPEHMAEQLGAADDMLEFPRDIAEDRNSKLLRFRWFPRCRVMVVLALGFALLCFPFVLWRQYAPRTMFTPQGRATNKLFLRGKEVQALWPAEWLKHHTSAELEQSAKDAEHWKEKTLNAMRHAYGAYSQPNVYGSDTVNPLTGGPGKTWGKGAYTMVDSLSTLWLMGMHDEFNEAAEWIEKNLHFEYTGYVSVFETIIRELGGLLSAYALSENPIFQTKAKELGDKLMPAFVEALPVTQISLGTGGGKGGWFEGSVLSEVSTLQLEFRYLSEITGDPKFREKGDAAMDYILEHGGNDGLVPYGWAYPSHAKNGPVNKEISFGARSDSYYEYLLKTYIQGNKKESKFLKAWQLSMKQMNERLVRRSGNDYAVVLKESSPGRTINEMDHLACFVGGMLVMADVALDDNDKNGYMSLGKNITAACFEMYKKHKTGLAPEIFQWNDGVAGPEKTVIIWWRRQMLDTTCYAQKRRNRFSICFTTRAIQHTGAWRATSSTRLKRKRDARLVIVPLRMFWNLRRRKLMIWNLSSWPRH
eukprot:GEMP01039406.1.p1 GENE.GEMP01039406.1~~GEMP01039406.1.p1  ORF type:complete len:536 (+),score=93.97 GEMP01039406.1:88-1695(+)